MSLSSHIVYFLLITAVTTLVTSVIRLSAPKDIVRETMRFFLTIVVGISLLSAVVFVVECIFLRPLI